MQLFNFFRNRKQSTDSLTNSNKNVTEPQTVDQELFVDDEKPKIEDDNEISKTRVNCIEKFLERDFEKIGFHDGYSYPETDFLEIKLNMLRADFRNAVDKCLDMKRSEVGELKIHIIRTEGISPRLKAQLEEKVKLLEMNIHELDMQKVLSIENEGTISPVIHAYRLGFRKGVEVYEQEKHFGNSTGLFN